MNFSFTGLDTDKKYTLVAYPVRGRYNNRWSRITLGGATSFTPQSSSGTVATTTVVTNDAIILNSGGNYINGYVAKWTDIDPATTSISIRQISTAYGADVAAAIYMNAIKLVEQGTATPDTAGPVISSIASSTVGTTANVTWTTDELATSTVEYGLTTSYGSSVASTTPRTSHNTQITGLTA